MNSITKKLASVLGFVPDIGIDFVSLTASYNEATRMAAEMDSVDEILGKIDAQTERLANIGLQLPDVETINLEVAELEATLNHPELRVHTNTRSDDAIATDCTIDKDVYGLVQILAYHSAFNPESPHIKAQYAGNDRVLDGLRYEASLFGEAAEILQRRYASMQGEGTYKTAVEHIIISIIEKNIERHGTETDALVDSINQIDDEVITGRDGSVISNGNLKRGIHRASGEILNGLYTVRAALYDKGNYNFNNPTAALSRLGTALKNVNEDLVDNMLGSLQSEHGILAREAFERQVLDARKLQAALMLHPSNYHKQ
jgi:hypothetical protein